MHVMLLSCFVLVLLMPGPCFTAPTLIPEVQSSPSTEPQVDLKLATEYLQQYYHLQEEPLGRMKRSGPSFTSKVKDMQIFFGINVTGVLDSETLNVMKNPRCGVPDVEEYSHTQGTRWNKNVITYRIRRYTRDLPRTTVDSLIESAFSIWARASSLTFVKSKTNNADIVMEFVTNQHGDLYPFDGPRGTLAHAFGPGLGVGGDTHFDDAEHWTAGETGPVRGRPNYLSRYGWLSGSLFPQNMQDKCAPDVTFDAVSTLGDATFFFRERYLWIKHNEQYDIKEGPITNFMPKIETSIDAAFWVPRRSTAYLIHESVFWTVKGSLVKGKARALSHFGFPAWVQDVDAAVHIVKTGRTLFFMHDIYWSYNENRRVMDSGYPKYISEGFPGLNTTINAAIHKEGHKYWVVQQLKMKSHAGSIYEYSFFFQSQGYLSDFYTDIWMGNSSVARLTNRSLSQDLETMQAFFGLEVTGVLNAETLEVMKAPRCGVSDISRYGHFHGKPRWQKRLITYRITRYTPDLAQSQVDATIAKAFQLYSDVIPLDFKQIYSGTADIMILFKGGPHGDFYPFDGRGGVLAHANSPGQGQGGDTHFDDDETWTLTQRGVNLLLVAAHEFGHALGLDHSRDRRALMYPTYQYVNTNGYRLPDDDKRSRTVQPPEPKPKPPPTPEPEPEPEPEDPDPLPSPRDEQCSRDLVFDAATSIKGDLFFFKNGYDEVRNQMDVGYPRYITWDFPGIGSKVDAVFENYGYLYFSNGPRQIEYDLAYKTVRRVLLNYGWLNCY
ncbi:hypothetical protein PAMA_020722 [Pampus argenteus]